MLHSIEHCVTAEVLEVARAHQRVGEEDVCDSTDRWGDGGRGRIMDGGTEQLVRERHALMWQAVERERASAYLYRVLRRSFAFPQAIETSCAQPTRSPSRQGARGDGSP